VPTSWVYAYDGPTALLEKYNLAMTGIAEWGGYPPSLRAKGGVHTAYLQPDVHIAHGAFGTGYPQVNTIFDPAMTYNGGHDPAG